MSKGNRGNRLFGESCPACKRRDALAWWTLHGVGAWLACDFCDYDERDDG